MAQTPAQRRAAQRALAASLASGGNPIAGMGNKARARAANPLPAPPVHSEAAPPPVAAPTGTEHLSPVQFSVKYTSSMHPGGASMAKPFLPVSSRMHPGGMGYTARSNGPTNKLQPSATPVTPSVASPMMSQAPKFKPTGPPTPAFEDAASALNISGGPRKRGNPMTTEQLKAAAAGKASSVGGGMRSAIKQRVSARKNAGKKLIVLRKSRFEGANSKHLSAATGA